MVVGLHAISIEVSDGWLRGLQLHIIKLHVRDDTFIYNQFKMTEQTDYNSMPLDELEKMVAGMPLNQMDTENPEPEQPKEEPQQSNGEAPTGESKETGEEPKGEPEQKEEQKPEEKGEPEKKTPESIKKLLHQRSELRQDNDRLKTELEEAREQLRKLRSWELDSEFKDSDGELDLEKREEAIQDASFNSKMIERELNNSTRAIDSNRELEMANFILENPDLADVKDELISYANAHKDLDIEDIKYLVLSKIDPTRLLDEQTKNKLSGNYSIPWKSYDGKEEQKEEDPKKMSLDKLWKKIEELGLL